jgi:hypothetical protein
MPFRARLLCEKDLEEAFFQSNLNQMHRSTARVVAEHVTSYGQPTTTLSLKCTEVALLPSTCHDG